MTSQSSLDHIEYQIILDIGMMHCKIGTSLNNLPFKIIDTPIDLLVNPEFLDSDYFKLYQNYTSDYELRIEEFLYSLFYD